MQFPLQITFKNMDGSEALEQAIRDRMAGLLHGFDRITGCHVVVDVQHRDAGAGRNFHVGIDLTLPGGRIAAGSGHDGDHADLQAALRSASAAVERQLADLREQRDPRSRSRAQALGAGD